MNEKKDKFCHILIVDDDPQVRELLAALLQAPNRSVERRDTARAALEFAKHNAIDIAFLDTKPAGMSGSELASKIKAVHPRSQVLIYSGHLNGKQEPAASPSNADRASRGAVDFGELLQLADSYTAE
jgi:DNA-binding NtrC family response regulator